MGFVGVGGISSEGGCSALVAGSDSVAQAMRAMRWCSVS